MTNFGSNKENIYFRVEDCNVRATTVESEASRFYVRYEQGSHFFRVNLYYESSGSTIASDNNSNNKLERSCFVTQISGTSMEWCVDPNLHLAAVVNRHGCCDRNCSLQLQHRDTNSQSYGYLVICEQKPQSSDPEEVESVDPEWWFQEGNKAFYVRCSAKPDQATSGNYSYLCIRRKVGYYRRQATYSTGCVPSIKHHNRRGRSMLFKLVRTSQ